MFKATDENDFDSVMADVSRVGTNADKEGDRCDCDHTWQ